MKKSKTSKPKTSKSESEGDSAKSSEPENFLIVGIGASAGGVAALKTFFENVPADSGSAYVVILHLSPDHDSQLAEVLRAVAAFPVAQVTERVRVEPNRVYVVPPNQHLEMTGGHIVVSPIQTFEERRAPVDIFFRTLAESHGERAVAVVLSGTGANGSMGIKRVKEKGGATFVQNPREAEFSEMPRNSIATDLIDLILNVADIPAQIVAYRNNPGKIEIPAEPEKQPKEKPPLQPQEQALVSIFTQLRVRTGHDFANYKRATMLRRIERRINVRGLTDITAYAAYLRENPDETHQLLKDLLISVTNFFRDKETFTFLENEILPKLFDGKTSDEAVRVWVAGCATGEEAYSLAMFLAGQTAKAENAPQIQIFATDIDEAAVAKAREGFYTLNDAADVSPERLKRFFTKETDGYRIRRELRETILFAHHNVIKDPPFSRLDLVTCRNMLIYLNHQAQERVMETFHFSLNAGGYLFLGNSETVDGAGNLYATVSREHRIYQSRQAVPRVGYPVPDASMQPIRFVEPIESEQVPENGHQRDARPFKGISFGGLHQQLLEEYTPSVVVNEDHDIVHMSESSLKFLKMSAGEPTQNLLKLVRPELRIELRTALYQAAQRKTNVEVPNVKIKIDGREEAINICIRPAMRQTDAARGFILILFESVKQSAVDNEAVYSSDEPVARQLEEELIRSKQQLRSSSEQYEVQAEEFKASNEELQAMNEELRSSSEELETGKEELQSLNEELGTVNQELKIKIEEISQTSNYLNNLINSTDIGTIFLDRLFRVELFTPAAAQIFNLIPADIGRPLTDIASQLEKTDLHADAKLVLETLQAVEREVRTVEGRDFVLRVLPYRTKDDKIGGVVLTFYDVTARKRAEEAVRESEERLQRAINIETVGVIFFNNDIEITDCNEAFVRMSGYKREELRAGRFSWEALTPEGFVQVSNRAIEELNTTGIATPYEKEYIRKDGSRFWAMFAAKRIGENEIVEFVTDITAQKRAEEILRVSESRLHLALDAAEMGTFLYHFDEDRGEPDARMLELFGLPEDGTLNLAAALAEIIYPDDHERYAAAMKRAADPNGGGFLNEEIRIVRPDQSLRWVVVTGQTIFADKPPRRSLTMYGVAADITERKQADEALRESEGRLRALVENLPGGAVFIVDKNLRYAVAEGEALANAGFAPENLVGRTIKEAMPPKLAAEYEALYRQALAGKAFEHEHDAHGRAFASRGLPLTDAADEVYAVLAVSYDITERKQAGENLRESEERFRAMFEQANVGIVQVDLKGRLIMPNPGFCEIVGYTEEECRGLNVRDITHPDDYGREEKLTRQLIKGKIPGFSIEKRYVCKDGGIVWGQMTTTVVRHQSNEPLYALAIVEDITERKRIEEELRESEERLRLLIESASDYAIFTMSPDSLINSWNAGAEKVFGWTEKEVLGKSGAIIFTPEDREKGAPEQEVETALHNGRAPDERFHIRKDGSRFYVSGVMMLLKDEGGSVRGFAKIARDMTEQIEAEKALRDKEMLQKLVGAQETERKRIARDLHDELGQQLTALRLKLDAAKKLCEDDELCGKVDEIELLAKSIDHGVDFLAWELRPAALDDLGLVAALDNYVKQWSHHSGVTAELLASNLKKTRFEPEVETNLYRIVQEALNNTHKHARAKSVEVLLERRDGLIVMLIEDNGRGFNPKDKKNPLKGMGLIGMKERAQLIGGTLEIESAPQKGTTVYVRVPAATAERKKSDGK